jgi:hypothetical protein
VIVVLHETARLRDSDTVVEREIVHVWGIRDGLAAHWRVFEDRERALEAVGLSD